MFTDQALRRAHALLDVVRDRYTSTTAVEAGTRVTLTLAHHATREITAGVVDDGARHAFTSGQCHAYALALALRHSYPLAYIGTVECTYDEDCLEYPESWGWCGCQIQHIVALRPDGTVEDVNGVKSVEQALADWAGDEEEELEVGLVDDRMLAWFATHHTWRTPRVDVALAFVDAPHRAEAATAAA